MDAKEANSINQAGTGFMLSLTDSIHEFEKKGYTENLVPRFDHFESRSGQVKLYPDDLKIDKVLRFENSSDPDDQSIMYAISSGDLKGLYVDSYGLYHDELSPAILDRLKQGNH